VSPSPSKSKTVSWEILGVTIFDYVVDLAISMPTTMLFEGGNRQKGI
jgi:hypothetical protein